MCSRMVSDTANRLRKTRKKKSSAVPLFAAVTCRQSAPDYPRERGDSQEGGNRRCLPSCAPARRQRTPPAAGRGESPRSAERNSPLRFSKKDCRPDRVNRPRGSSTPLGRCRKSGKSRKNFPARKGGKNAHSHAEKTSIRTVQLAKPNRPEFSRKILSKKCLTYWLGYANLYTWLAEAY